MNAKPLVRILIRILNYRGNGAYIPSMMRHDNCPRGKLIQQ
jgi:hypothetical protein